MSKQNSFRLQSVLNYKTSMVDNLETEFAELRAAQKNEEEALAHLEAMVQEHTVSLQRQQENSTLNCQTIELHQKYLHFLHNHVARQKLRVAEAARQVEAKREELVKMMQEQKTLEKLKDHHVARERIALNRRESRVVDDLVTTRYAREGYSHA